MRVAPRNHPTRGPPSEGLFTFRGALATVTRSFRHGTCAAPGSDVNGLWAGADGSRTALADESRSGSSSIAPALVRQRQTRGAASGRGEGVKASVKHSPSTNPCAMNAGTAASTIFIEPHT